MKFNLRFKLVFSVILIVSFILIIFLFQSLSRERETFQTSFEERAKVLALALDSSIGSLEQLKDTSKLQNSIYKLIWLYPELVKISINVSGPDGLIVVASNKTEEIGRLASPESLISFNRGELLTENIVLADKTKVLSVVTPIRIGGARAGTYEIFLSLETEENLISQRRKEIVIALLFSICTIIGIQLILLNHLIILPIAEIKKGLEIFGKGNLKWRIKIKNQDEIGQVAQGFNQMAEQLEELYQEMEKKVAQATEELEEAKAVLEIKVRARTKELQDLTEHQEEIIKERTKELQKRIDELENFQRLTVGRELKIVALKEEIEQLKKQLKNKKPKNN